MPGRKLNAVEITYRAAVVVAAVALVAQTKAEMDDPLRPTGWGSTWAIAVAALFPVGISVWMLFRGPTMGIVTACIAISGLWCLFWVSLIVDAEWRKLGPHDPPRAEAME